MFRGKDGYIAIFPGERCLGGKMALEHRHSFRKETLPSSPTPKLRKREDSAAVLFLCSYTRICQCCLVRKCFSMYSEQVLFVYGETFAYVIRNIND